MQAIKRRFFDIIYLYGFKSSDLKNYLFFLENKNLINSQYKLSEKEYLNYEKRSSFIFYQFIYHMLQIDSTKVTKNLTAQYQKYWIVENLRIFIFLILVWLQIMMKILYKNIHFFIKSCSKKNLFYENSS